MVGLFSIQATRRAVRRVDRARAADPGRVGSSSLSYASDQCVRKRDQQDARVPVNCWSCSPRIRSHAVSSPPPHPRRVDACLLPPKNTKLTRGHPPAVHSHGPIKISEGPALLCPQPRRGIADLVPWRRSEIFDIVSALETAEGKGTTFYSFLNTTKSADEKAIAKAYRKRSLELQQVLLVFSFPPRFDRTADLESTCTYTARTRTQTTKRSRTALPASASSPTSSRTPRSASSQSHPCASSTFPS